MPGIPVSDTYVKEFTVGVASNLNEMDWWTAGSGYQPWGDAAWTQSTDAVEGLYALQISGSVTNDAQWYIGGNGCAIPVPKQDWSANSAVIVYGKQGNETNKVQPKFKLTLDNDYAETNGNEAVLETKVANTNYYEMVMAFDDFLVDDNFAWTNVKMVKIEFFTGEAGEQPNDLFLDEFRLASITLTNGEDNLKWKGDWCDQLYALEDFADADVADPDALPDYVNVFTHFRNVHMINWFHVKKFEDGFTKDFKVPEDEENGVVYGSYYDRIKAPYFLTHIVLDSDGDGLSDDWEEEHFPGGGEVTNADASTDSDFDGLSNYDEFVAGSNPTNDESSLVMGVAVVVATNGFVIEWESHSNRMYALERSTNLMTGFSSHASRITSTPPLNTYTDVVGNAGMHLYRIRVMP